MKKKTRLPRNASLPADTFSIVRHHFHQFPLILLSWNFKERELQIDHDKKKQAGHGLHFIRTLSKHGLQIVYTLSKNDQ